MKKKFAVILSGCGVYDGSEIHEAIFTLFAIAKHGCTYQIFAPDINQYHVINHLNGEVIKEDRNVLVESARIARGNAISLKDFNANDYDALIFPGGSGAIKNLCTFAFDGINARVLSEVEKAVKAMHALHKPIGALCIAPIILAKILGNVEITIGTDKKISAQITEMGASHTNTKPVEVTIDKRNNIYTTPCYMLAQSIVQVAEGADNIVKAMVDSF